MPAPTQRNAMRRRAGAVAALGSAIAALPSVARAEGAAAGLSLDGAQLGARQPSAALAATRVAPRAPRMPAVLAGGRPDMQQAYTMMLSAFEQNLDKQRMPRNDVAIAAAMYVAGAYAAYHGTQVGDAAFTAMVPQLRSAIGASPAFVNAPMGQRQDMYEGLAITGTLMAVTAAQKPGDEGARAAARSYLETFLHASADAIRVDERGISVAAAVPPPAVAETVAAPALAPAPALVPPPAPPPGPPPVAEAAPPRPSFPAKKVAALLWKTEMRYEAFPANSMVMAEESYLLLADGTCTGRVPSSLEEFDPKADRAAHPKSWCKWRKRGAGYEVAFGDKWQAVNGATVLRAAKRGEHLAGTWTRSKTGSIGTASTWKGTTLVLGADGRFELQRAGAFTTNSNLNRPQGEVVASGTYGNDRARGDVAGTYALDGFGIELRYDSGRIERQMFGISTDDNHVFVRLGGDMMPKRK